MKLLELPPELLHKILLQAVKLRGVRLALRLRLVNKVLAYEVAQAIFATRLADKTPLHRPCQFWNSYILYRSLAAIYEASPFNIVRRVANRICEWNGRLDDASLRTCVASLSPLALSVRVERRYDFSSCTYREAHFNFHLLAAAAYLGLMPLIEELLATGMDPSRFCKVFGSPLRAAAARGNEDIVRLFVSHPKLSKNKDMHSWVAGGAMEGGHLDILDIGLSLITDIDAPGNRILRLFIESKLPGKNLAIYQRAHEFLNPSSLDCRPLTIASLGKYVGTAAGEGNFELVQYFLVDEYLIDRWPTIVRDTANSLLTSCDTGDEKTVQFILSRGTDPNWEIYGRTPLQNAAARGHLGIVRLLLDHGANVRTGNSPSALLYAFLLEYRAMWALLIARGARLRSADIKWAEDRDLDDEWLRFRG